MQYHLREKRGGVWQGENQPGGVILRAAALCLLVIVPLNLISLSVALLEETRRCETLEREICETEKAVEICREKLQMAEDDTWFQGYLRSLGYVSQEDLVFFDGG